MNTSAFNGLRVRADEWYDQYIADGQGRVGRPGEAVRVVGSCKVHGKRRFMSHEVMTLMTDMHIESLVAKLKYSKV